MHRKQRNATASRHTLDLCSDCTCGSERQCASSFDDRPAVFIEPLDYANAASSRAEAMSQLIDAIRELDGKLHVVDATSGSVKAEFITPLYSDIAEFFLENEAYDTVCNLRSIADTASVLPDLGRNRRRLRQLKTMLRWEYVPVLRNRTRLLGIAESPFDSFGPPPPVDALDPRRSDDVFDPI